MSACKEYYFEVFALTFRLFISFSMHRAEADIREELANKTVDPDGGDMSPKLLN